MAMERDIIEGGPTMLIPSAFDSDSRRRRDAAFPLGVAALYAALCGGLVLLSGDSGFGHGTIEWALSDQRQHLDQINYLRAHPGDLLTYPASAATTPGFHLLIATVARVLGIESVAGDSWLRLVPFSLGLATLALLWHLLRTLCADARLAALLCLPILLSKYFLVSSVFFATENGAYAGYILLLLAFLRFPERGLPAGLAGAAMVFVRQIFLPVVGVHALSYFARRSGRHAAWPRTVATLAAGALPPLAVVGVFAISWGGLVPPGADPGGHVAATIPNLSPVVETWSLLGLLALPYSLLALSAGPLPRGGRPALLLGAALAAALLLWLLASTVFPPQDDLEGGASPWGSVVWFVARHSPALGEHAVLLLPCLLLGFIAAAAAAQLAWARHEFPAELAMFTAYTLALSVQSFGFQRYTEVPALLTLSVAAARLPAASRGACLLFLAAFAAKLPLSLALQGFG